MIYISYYNIYGGLHIRKGVEFYANISQKKYVSCGGRRFLFLQLVNCKRLDVGVGEPGTADPYTSSIGYMTITSVAVLWEGMPDV